ncbi:acyltransferase [Variovorax paradoxus]|uniref:acyltransferase n=1 Tax=Variovorax paradoxus TaxID=34073 RepID=UPI003ECDA8A3
MAMLSREDIEALGFLSIGENLQISDRASFYGADRITLGSNVRIDDFCVLAAGAGGISVGDYVHIAVGAALIGAGKITLSDFSGLSSRVSIYSSSDDYSGAAMTNPTVPAEYTDVKHADVFLGRHVIIGSGSVVLPGIKLEDGVAVGALSLIQKNCTAFGIYAGNPARRISERKRDLLEIELRMKASKAK